MSFLDAYNQHEESRVLSTPPSKRGFLFILLSVAIIIGGCVIGGVWLARTGRMMVADGRTAFSSIMTSIDALKAKQFVDARTHAAAAVTEWNALDERVRSVAWLARIPFIGTYAEGAFDVVAAGVFASRGLARAVDIAERLRAPLGPLAQSIDFRALPVAERHAFFATLTATSDDIHTTVRDFRNAIDVFARAYNVLPSSLVPARMRGMLEQLATINMLFARIEDAVFFLPHFAGYPEPTTALFLFQNNDELRPTGGFIGTYGLLKTNAGVIESLRTDDVYRLDKGAPKDVKLPKPPIPLRKFLGVKQWYFRDANWSPDFPTSAQLLLDLYKREDRTSPTPASIIAITPVVLEHFMRLTGPLTIDGIRFTADNVTDTLEYEVEQGFAKRGIKIEDRKKIIGALTDAVVAALLRMPPEVIPNFFATITTLLNEKHIVLYHTDPATQASIAARGWGSAFPSPSQQNFLAVIDANLGSLKTDQVMQRSIAYTIDYTRPRPRAEVAITYRHVGQFTWKTTRYQTYTRLFVPAGSTLVRAGGVLARPRAQKPGIPDVGTELGYTTFGGFIAIEPGSQGALTFVFDLPERLRPYAAPSADLFVYKQSGTDAVPLTIAATFDTTVRAANPGEVKEEWGDNMYRVKTDLRTDQWITIQF